MFPLKSHASTSMAAILFSHPPRLAIALLVITHILFAHLVIRRRSDMRKAITGSILQKAQFVSFTHWSYVDLWPEQCNGQCMMGMPTGAVCYEPLRRVNRFTSYPHALIMVGLCWYAWVISGYLGAHHSHLHRVSYLLTSGVCTPSALLATTTRSL